MEFALVKTSRLRLLAAGLALASTLGCRCGPPTTSGTTPDYQASPTAVSFEACPTKDETGQPVPDVFPDTQKITIENRARASGGLKLSFTGANADAFSVVQPAPTAIGSLSSVEVQVQFKPTSKGDQSAQLVIDDEYEGTDNRTVTLVGTGRNLPAQASLGSAPQKTDKSGFLECEASSPLPDCTLQFPDTQYDQSDVMEVKIRNLGCPALKITGLKIESARGDQQDFAIEAPATVPTEGSPMLLSTADGTQEMTVRIRFSPVDDGSGNNDRFASLVILSNDPLIGDGFAQPARISLSATAVKPSIYTSPTFCDFTNPLDRCGETTKVPNAATFTVTNDGNAAVRIKSVKFRSSGGSTGAGGRFTISQDITGQTLAAVTGTATLKLAHNDMPLYVSDILDIEAVLPGPPERAAGTISVALYGGLKPCLTTDPMDTMNFNDPADETTAQTLLIKNGAGCGTLIVNEVSIESNPFFTLLDPKVAPNTQIAAGAQVEATVQYKRPPSGGMQVGTLRVRTNDTDFGAPQFKIVQLLSQSPLDQVPVATITACTSAEIINDSQCSMGPTTSKAVNLSMLTTKVITLSGIKSTDDKQVSKYRFKLLPPLPPGVTTGNLASHDQQITTPTTTLTIPDGSTGLYRISLEVWDDRGQKSGNTSVMLLNAYP
jgi:hypothetical protein